MMPHWNHKRIQELGEALRTQAVEIASREEAAPVLFILPKDKEMEIVGITLNDETKQVFKEAVTKLLRMEDAIAYYSVFEGWATRPQDPAVINRIQSGQVTVSELPPDDRFEILVFNEVENGQPVRVFQAEIKRDRANTRLIQPWVETKTASYEGRMLIEKW